MQFLRHLLMQLLMLLLMQYNIVVRRLDIFTGQIKHHMFFVVFISAASDIVNFVLYNIAP